MGWQELLTRLKSCCSVLRWVRVCAPVLNLSLSVETWLPTPYCVCSFGWCFWVTGLWLGELGVVFFFFFESSWQHCFNTFCPKPYFKLLVLFFFDNIKTITSVYWTFMMSFPVLRSPHWRSYSIPTTTLWSRYYYITILQMRTWAQGVKSLVLGGVPS